MRFGSIRQGEENSAGEVSLVRPGKLPARRNDQTARVMSLRSRALQIWREQGSGQVLGLGLRKLGRKLAQLWRCYREEGVRSTAGQLIRSLVGLRHARVLDSFVQDYDAWMARHEPGPEELARQRGQVHGLAMQPIISLVTPVFNPPAWVLEEMIRSVLAQTYPHWELCLADGGSSDPAIQEILADHARKDPRIKVQQLPKNLGIIGNSNQALALATGEFVGLLDQDDLLAPAALFEVASFLNEHPDTDMVYSDEDKIDENGRRFAPFFKPEWSPDLLISFMYVGHLTVYRRSLLREVGGFPSGCEYSQDYDLALRITERTQAIGHIPKVLYHWRALPGSAAADGKPYARGSNLQALASAAQRRGYDAVIREYPFANRIQGRVSQEAFVSIIIPSDCEKHIRTCVEAVFQNTAFPRYEALVVTNSRLIERLGSWAARKSRLEFVAYDRPFNFSAKCNRGAERARGDWLLFLNDDVVPLAGDWLEAMMGQFYRLDVGAVGPRLLYANGRIQHAGMVTGVRGLVGTAFHGDPADSYGYMNFARSTRNTSILSGACLLMPRLLFQQVHGFDDVNTPIEHSDVDLCFKIRERGFQLVYTPFATLRHIGHASLAGATMLPRKGHSADLYLLKRWGGYTADDPYYPENMRAFLYRDAPTPYQLIAKNNAGLENNRGNLLLCSPELTHSDLALEILSIARQLWDAGYFVAVYAPEEGPLREQYRESGIPLFLDPLICASVASLRSYLADFDLFVLATIQAAGLVHLARELHKPTVWIVSENELTTAELDRRSARDLADRLLDPAEGDLGGSVERFVRACLSGPAPVKEAA